MMSVLFGNVACGVRQGNSWLTAIAEQALVDVIWANSATEDLRQKKR